jgi:hypothetical protein
MVERSSAGDGRRGDPGLVDPSHRSTQREAWHKRWTDRKGDLADRVELGEAEAPLSINFVPAAA